MSEDGEILPLATVKWWKFVSQRPEMLFALALKGELFKNVPLPAGESPKKLGKFEDAKPFDYARWKAGFNKVIE